MTTVLELMGVAVMALLSENFILVNSMGVGSRVRSLQEPMDALRSGFCLTCVMVLGSLLSWPIDRFLLIRFRIQHYRLLIFALLVPAIVGLLRFLLRTFIPELGRRLDGNLAAVTGNMAALGSALLISQRSMSFGAGLLFAFFGGVGATVALVSFASLRQEVDLEHCPRSFRGLPIQLITAGLMALSLVGFYGLNFGR